MERPRSKLFYTAAQHIIWGILKTFWRFEVQGHQYIPKQGGVIIAANHLSLADPPVVGCSLQREVHFLAKEDLFRIPLFGNLIRTFNALPLRRKEPDIRIFKILIRLLKSGEILVMFPEGTRRYGQGFGRPQPGVGLLAARAQVPVVPTYIHNTHYLLRLAKIAVVFAPPIPPPSLTKNKECYQRFSWMVMDKIKELKKTYIESVAKY